MTGNELWRKDVSVRTDNEKKEEEEMTVGARCSNPIRINPIGKKKGKKFFSSTSFCFFDVRLFCQSFERKNGIDETTTGRTLLFFLWIERGNNHKTRKYIHPYHQNQWI